MISIWNKIFSAVRELTTEEDPPLLTSRQRSQQNEMENAVLVLAAEVVRCDKNYNQATEEVLHAFMGIQFGPVGKAYRQKSMLRHLEEGTEPLIRIAARQLNMLTTYDSRLTILEFLFAVADADDYVNERELKRLHRIAGYMKVKEVDFINSRQRVMGQRNPFTLLGVDENVTPAELKKAYRAKVLKYHPDKRDTAVSEKEAEAAFIKLKRAYDLAKARMAG